MLKTNNASLTKNQFKTSNNPSMPYLQEKGKGISGIAWFSQARAYVRTKYDYDVANILDEVKGQYTRKEFAKTEYAAYPNKKPLYTLDTFEDDSSVGSKESDGTKQKKFDRKIRKIEIANKEIERSNYDLMERYKFERDDTRKANEKLEAEEKEYTTELLKMAAELWGGISDKLQETICIKSGKDKATIIKHPEIFLPLVTECHRTRIKQPRVIKKNRIEREIYKSFAISRRNLIKIQRENRRPIAGTENSWHKRYR